MPSARYEQFVHRVWDRLEHLTGQAPNYLDAASLASRCPACLEGTLRTRFYEYPEPRAVFSSRHRDTSEYSVDYLIEVERMLAMLGEETGGCSNGCTAAEITEALA